MDRPQQCTALLVLSAALFTTTQCTRPATMAQISDARDNANVPSVAAAPLPGPALQGKAGGEVLRFEFEGGDLRAKVLSHPAPEMWLVFPAARDQGQSHNSNVSTDGVKVELPPEAKRLLRLQWETALPAAYDWELGGVSSVSARSLLSATIMQSSQKASLELTKVIVDAPGGRRPLTLGEGVDLASFVGKAVFEIVEQAKGFKKSKSMS
jgi:hypothetical protein